MTSRFRNAVLPIATLAAAASLALPASASAILVGVESNRELVNSDRTPALQDEALAKMQGQGASVVRANFGWNEIAGGCAGQTPAQLRDHTNACLNWQLLDSLVSQARARNLKMLLSFTRVPQWVLNNPDGSYMGRSAAEFNTVIAHYSAFMTAAGTRYAKNSPIGFVPYWTILNEPNSPFFWKPAPNPQRYAQIYARAAVALKTANPSALVAPGPTGPTGGSGGIKPKPFLIAFQKHATKYLPGRMATKRRYLNAYAHNPYPSITGQPSVASKKSHPEWITMATIDRLFLQLDKSPLTKGTKVWATEFGWETPPDRKFGTTMARQAQFIAEAFDWLDAKKRVTIGISYGLTDPLELPDFQSGTYMANGTPKPSLKMFQRMVSVPQAGTAHKVKRGTVVKIWGRSNIAPKTGLLAYQLTGSPTWRIVPRQKRAADGSIRAAMKLTAKGASFAIYDKGNATLGIAAGYGPTRVFRTY